MKAYLNFSELAPRLRGYHNVTGHTELEYVGIVLKDPLVREETLC